jgi:hypothetical protein
MKKRMLVCLLGLLFSLNAFAQNDYAFRVLINKGKNEYKSGQNWLPIKVGSNIGSKDEIKVLENSYIGLVHVSGKSIELKDAKTYNVADLSAKVGQGSSVLAKYTDFILSANTTKKNNLSATGAVSRGANNIKMYLPRSESALVYNTQIIINWEKDKAQGPYVVTFKSMFGDELKKVEAPTNQVIIDLSEVSFENEDNILVDVVSKSDKSKFSEQYTIKRLSRADKERIKVLLAEIKDAVAEPTALNKYELAGFYEKNGLLIDAITSYLEAIKLAPEVSQFQEDYNAFLLRNDIKERPAKK